MDIASVGASLTQVGAASLTQVQNSTQVPVQISLSYQDHVPPSWQTLPHSSRCSCHQCKRL